MNSNTNNKLDTPENSKEFYLVSIYSTIMFALSCLGALYVLYRTYMYWIYLDEGLILFRKRRLSMSFKLPFYTACIDLFDNCISLINILYTAVNANVLEEPACKTISALLWGFATLNLSLYLVIAFDNVILGSQLTFGYEKLFNFGKYDYKLWLSVLIFSSIFQLINLHNHGARKYWCSGKSGQLYSSITIFCLIIFTLIIILFCYINVLLKFYLCSEIESTNKKVAKKIISYVLIFFFHWIPIVIQNLGRFLKVEHPWLYILKSSGHAMGSFGNAVVYIINEGVVARPVKIDSNELYERNEQNNEEIDASINLDRLSVSITLKSLQDILDDICNEN